MAHPPITAFAMHPVVMEQIVRADHIERLRRCCSLPLPEPVRHYDQLAALAPTLEILITSWGCPPVTQEVLERLPALKLIAHLAGSVKGFVDASAWARGIRVTNAVAANAVPVAEYTLAAILFANKRVLQLRDFYRRHHENRAPWTKEAPNVGNYRKRIGIIGASSVGRKLIELLEAFDLERFVYDPYIGANEARAMGVMRVDLPTLLRRCDVVTLHAPLLADTHHMLGAREFAQMKDGATFINTARGGLIDQQALLRELQTGRIDAVLDTTEPEVLPADSPLYRLPNVFLTPHIAGSLGSEVQRLADYIVTEIESFVAQRPLRFGVQFNELPQLA